jgi:hypothetical protein
MGSGTEMPAISAETAEQTNGSAATSKKESNLLLACFHAIPESWLLVENEHVCKSQERRASSGEQPC